MIRYRAEVIEIQKWLIAIEPLTPDAPDSIKLGIYLQRSGDLTNCKLGDKGYLIYRVTQTSGLWYFVPDPK